MRGLDIGWGKARCSEEFVCSVEATGNESVGYAHCPLEAHGHGCVAGSQHLVRVVSQVRELSSDSLYCYAVYLVLLYLPQRQQFCEPKWKRYVVKHICDVQKG